MVGVFIARAELIPQGETLEEHKKLQKDEADAVQQDKDNKDSRTGGLFKGCFRPLTHHGRGPSLQVIRDQEDGVDRCPVCNWELEDGECTQCGLVFDVTGQVSWGDSFTGFSDMDEMSEHDAADDLDAGMDVDDVEFDGYDEAMDGWRDYLPEQDSFMMRRYLEGNIPQNAAYARRVPMTHSEAGSRRSYTQSIVSDIRTEMDTVEEEDEDGLEEDDVEDSEMDDFIDDEIIAASSSASTESSTPGPTSPPSQRPSAARPRAQGRVRRIVESETSSTISSVIEEEEEDEEDQGPIRRGLRHPSQTRVLHRANGSRSSHGPPSSVSTDASTEEPDEDEQALLREEGWMLQQDDDEMGEDDEDDSDGGRTTVGWEPLANSNNRSRMGGSLTPTADRTRPSAPIRPPSRTANVRVIDTSRGLRRRPSILSASTVPYEDGEADDDDSDQDGDINMAMHALRTRRSQAQMRNGGTLPHPAARFPNGGPVSGDAANDLDTDDTSDNSQPGNGRQGPRTQRRQYDPRISWMFAAHQQALQQHQMSGALIDIESRSITPLARPRTRNRNRPSPAQAFSPFMPPTRLRTPLMDDTSNLGPALRMPISPPRRSAMSPAQSFASGSANMSRFDRAPSVSSNSNASAIMTPGTSTPTSEHSIDSIAQTQSAAAIDMIDRPQSRVSARPNSAAGRRNSAGFPPVNPTFPHTTMGLHAQGSALPPFQARGNPWAAYVQARAIRARTSRQVLREQSSVATLRPVSSRVNIRDVGDPPQAMRPQASRINLRTQPSRRQLNTQSSTRTLRASEHARPPPSPSQAVQAPNQPVARRLTPDERDTRARELIETRRRALGQPNNTPARTNPFTQGIHRPANPAPPSSMPPPPMGQHVRSNSNESMQSVNSAGTAQGAPTSPTLGRRRSNRNMMNAPPPGVLPPTQGQYTSPATAYASNYYRARTGPVAQAPSAYETSLHNNNNRAPNPMMAGPLI